jgi:hypothetical protein
MKNGEIVCVFGRVISMDAPAADQSWDISGYQRDIADAPDQTGGLPSDVPTTPHEVGNVTIVCNA